MADNGVVNAGFELNEKVPENGHAGDGFQTQENTTPVTTSSFKRRQSCLGRCFFSPVVFTVFLVIWTITKASSSGYSSGTLTTFEKRFQLKSSQIGYFAVVEDIVGLSTVMFIVHYGQSTHRPRFIGLLTLIVAAGVAIQGLPHFFYKLPESFRTRIPKGNATEAFLLCTDEELEVCTDEEKESAGSLLNQAFWHPIGSAIISLGGGIAPISITYLDDNVTRRAMPIYAGIVFSIFAFGSIFGFFLASFTLTLPVTWPVNDPAYYSAKQGDSNWLGAWWLGYFIFSFLLALFGLILCSFPRQMRDPEELARENAEYVANNPIPESAKAKVKREKTVDGNFESYSGFIEFLKDFLVSLSQIVRNVVVMCITLSGCLIAFTSTIFLIFGPKFLSVVYGLNASFAALAMAMFLIPGAFLGQILGGLLIRCFKFTRYGLAAFGASTDVTLLLGVAFFYFVRCEPAKIAGLQGAYYPGIDSLDGIDAPCNMDCGCPSGEYDPVCGSDGVTYVTGCHAGCDYRINKTYYDCACIPVNGTDSGILGTAEVGECKKPCGAWLIYIMILVPTSFIGTMGGISGFMLQIRSVDDAHRGLAMSFGNVLIRIIGYIPGPLIIGAVIDKSCILYQSTCNETGNCDVYSSRGFQLGFITTMLVATLLSTCFIVASYFYVRYTTPKGKRVWRQQSTEDDGKPNGSHTKV